jgi:PPOX class probable F420-dependent enzyme
MSAAGSRPRAASDPPKQSGARETVGFVNGELGRCRDVLDRLDASTVPLDPTSRFRKDSPMTNFPEAHRDLLQGQVVTLATVDRDGFPQLSVVWFLLDDDGKLRISLNSSRAKTAYLRERPECSLLFLDLQNPYRYLEVRGRARIDPDDDYTFASKVGAKYNADLRAYDGPGDNRVVVTIDPVKIYAVDMGG